MHGRECRPRVGMKRRGLGWVMRRAMAGGICLAGAVRATEANPPAAPGGEPAGGTPVIRHPLDPAPPAFFEVSLSNVVNRALADDEANDGEGGWTDQGPGFDLGGFGTGRKEYDGVPFAVLAPRSCVVLSSPQRPQSKLPLRVTIPVNRKADALYFLHTGALLKPGATNWTYVIGYADGRRQVIPVLPGVNVRNWENSNNPEFDNPQGMRTTPAPERVGNALSPVCGVYVTEWTNPRSDTAIRTIEMVSAEQGVPILLAITGREGK